MNEESVRGTAKSLVSAGHKAFAVHCDVADDEQVAAMVDQTVSAFGQLDAAFNNAGVQSPVDLSRNHRYAHDRQRFIGAWRLASLEEEGADGNVHRADCTGLLVYAPDGHMSVQVMYRDQQTGSAMASACSRLNWCS